jgi:hypothetical protein
LPLSRVKEICTISEGEPSPSIMTSSVEEIIASVRSDKCELLTIPKEEARATFELHEPKPELEPGKPCVHVAALAFSADGCLLAIAAGHGFRQDHRTRSWVDVWDLPGRRLLETYDLGGCYLSFSGGGLAFSPSGDLLAVGCDSEVRLFRR